MIHFTVSDWGSGALLMIHFTIGGLNLGPERALGGPLDFCHFCVLLGSTPGRVGGFVNDIFLLKTGKSQHHSAAGA